MTRKMVVRARQSIRIAFTNRARQLFKQCENSLLHLASRTLRSARPSSFSAWPIQMNRRSDQNTAELIDLVLLTRAAFGIDRALRYVALAELPQALLYQVLGRPERSLRNRGKHAGLVEEGRRRCRRGR